jgi:hypothetical protein
MLKIDQSRKHRVFLTVETSEAMTPRACAALVADLAELADFHNAQGGLGHPDDDPDYQILKITVEDPGAHA